MDEEALILWQDIFDEIAAGRSDQLRCPKCGHTPLSVERSGPMTKISCASCQAFIEGRFAV